MEAEESGGEKGQGDVNGEGSSLEPQGSVNYVHCRTGESNLQAWRHVLDKDIPDQ